MMFLSKNWYFSVQKALIYYTVNKSLHNSFILLVFLHVANFRYVANFRFLTLTTLLECSHLPDISESKSMPALSQDSELFLLLLWTHCHRVCHMMEIKGNKSKSLGYICTRTSLTSVSRERFRTQTLRGFIHSTAFAII